jgi:alpha-L-fucosidase
MKLNLHPRSLTALLALLLPSGLPVMAADQKALDEHAVIGVNESKAIASQSKHPDAQWFPDAGFGFFIHWGIYTAGELNDVSWPMIPGSKLRDKRITDPAERARIIRERDYNKEEHPLIPPQRLLEAGGKIQPFARNL